jgi:hypothetical protein
VTSKFYDDKTKASLVQRILTHSGLSNMTVCMVLFVKMDTVAILMSFMKCDCIRKILRWIGNYDPSI